MRLVLVGSARSLRPRRPLRARRAPPGLTGHDYGWEDDEDAALGAMRAAGTRLRGQPQGGGIGRPTWAAEVLEQINAARRRASPETGAAEAAPVEYLYEPWSWYDDNSETHKGINAITIVKKTAQADLLRPHGFLGPGRGRRHPRVHRPGGVQEHPVPGQLPEDTPAGPVCGPHRRDFPTASTSVPARTGTRVHGPGGCGETARRTPRACNAPGHGYAWEHSPHGSSPGGCYHGSAAGLADLPGRAATAAAAPSTPPETAEDYLFRWERDQERKRKEGGPELRRLRMAMADAHPDRGGTNEGFVAARERYERALRTAS